MVLRAHVLLRITAGFLKKKKNCCPQNGGNGFFNLLENLVIFFWTWSITKVYIIGSILPQITSHIWGKSGSSDMIQNALNQSDYRIFKSIISLKQNDEDQIFCMLIQSHGNKKSVEKNCGGSSQKWMLPL